MNAQLSSRFESRDMADLAVMRLRRSGIAFSVSRVALENHIGHGTAATATILPNFGMENSLGIDTGVGTFAPLTQFHGYTAERGSSENTVLSIKVRSDQLNRARDILRSSNGSDIRITV